MARLWNALRSIGSHATLADDIYASTNRGVQRLNPKKAHVISKDKSKGPRAGRIAKRVNQE